MNLHHYLKSFVVRFFRPGTSATFTMDADEEHVLEDDEEEEEEENVTNRARSKPK